MNEDENTGSTLGNILDKLPPDKAVATAKALLHYGVHDGDPTVTMIDIAIDTNAARLASTEAAQAAGEAASTVTEQIGKIPDTIYRGAVRAGEDLASQVTAAGQAVAATLTARGEVLRQGLTDVIAAAATAGGAQLEKAVAMLGATADARRDELVREMQVAVAAAARDQIRAAVIGKAARTWSMIALSLVVFMAFGAAAGLGAARLMGHLTPWTVQLATTPTGQPACGTLRGKRGRVYGVCLTR